MKTVIDAVNDLRCDLNNLTNSLRVKQLSIMINTIDNKLYGTISSEYSIDTCRGIYNFICSIDHFNSLVTELSQATWIQGASLAEYQAADKEVLKVENKTGEFGGMVYEIGKVYEFSDNADGGCWIVGVLESINHGNTFHFTVAGCEGYKHCRSLPSSCFGTITPQSVKLIDGEVYSFNNGSDSFLGRFKESDGVFIWKDYAFDIRHCFDVVHLTPSK